MGVVDLVDAYRRYPDRGGDGVPEDGGPGGPFVCVDELVRDDFVPEEGLPVGEVGVREACVGGGVEPSVLGELCLG